MFTHVDVYKQTTTTSSEPMMIDQREEEEIVCETQETQQQQQATQQQEIQGQRNTGQQQVDSTCSQPMLSLDEVEREQLSVLRVIKSSSSFTGDKKSLCIIETHAH